MFTGLTGQSDLSFDVHRSPDLSFDGLHGSDAVQCSFGVLKGLSDSIGVCGLNGLNGLPGLFADEGRGSTFSTS